MLTSLELSFIHSFTLIHSFNECQERGLVLDAMKYTEIE